MTPRRVLVTDGEQRSALAVVRSLGRAGHHVFVCASRRYSLAGSSRFASGHAAVPDALASPADCAASVRELVARWSIDTLLPVTEPSLFALLAARDTLDALVPAPPLERVRQITDKTCVMAAATGAGIAIPGQRIANDPEALVRASLTLNYPVVLKPSRSINERVGPRQKHAVRHAADVAELRTAAAELPAAAYPLLVQQRVIGPGIGIFLLIQNGTVLARFAHRRIREKPPSGGVSVYRESIPADPVLVERSAALLAAFGWSGVAMVEYKIDSRTGVPYLMEINGRFWGSLQLAIDAGVDFPALLVAAAWGDIVTPELPYRIGVRSRWWWGDVDHLIARIRHSPRALALPPNAPGRWHAVRDFFSHHDGDRNEILRRDDPMPFVRESIDWLRRL